VYLTLELDALVITLRFLHKSVLLYYCCHLHYCKWAN